MNRVGVPEVLGGRLSLQRRIGAGAFGTVYEAIDTKFGSRVAVKILAREQSQAIYRFKREFRSIADVVHPNLVRLYELVASDEALYFTMELVEGRDFLAYLTDAPASVARTVTTEIARGTGPWPWPRSAPRPATDLLRLREAFRQLARGVQAVHAAGKLHCDIKPSNVLVGTDHRVVLLDFGLVADLRGDGDVRRGAMGTPGYAAPEQVAGAALTPAADWYSVGAMLFEALTGELPLTSTHVDVPGDADLAALTAALLDPDPARRPDGNTVVRLLGGEIARGALADGRLFGRTRELDELRAARREASEAGPVVVRVVGASGLGKTALLDAFLDELRADHLVLRGRCYEHESVPYKALDTVIDAIAEYLRRLGPDAQTLLPPDAARLARVFPVLRDVIRDGSTVDEMDSQEQRRQAFALLREVIHRIAERVPIACSLDDLQWGDIDSARLLADLLRPPGAPRMLVVLGHRPDPSAPFLQAFDEWRPHVAIRVIELGELEPDHARELARHLLGAASDLADAVVREGAGNPLFIHQLAQRRTEDEAPSVEGGLSGLILARVHALPLAAQRLLQTIALSGQPIDEHIALRAAMLEGDASQEATLAVRHARLVGARTVGANVVLEPVHDRVRETLVGSLPAAATRSGHRAIAEALLAMSTPDPDRLVHHFRGAGDAERTLRYAIVAADRADGMLAFERAAGYRGLILELSSSSAERWQLHERYAGSLANAGRAIEAADAYEQAAIGLSSASSVPGRDVKVHILRRLAGELTLRSGRLALGESRMKRVLSDVGVSLPRSRRTALWLTIGRRLRLLTRNVDATPRPSPASRLRLDAIWSACTGITQLDNVVGDALALQHLLEALDHGDRTCIVRGLGLESVHESVIGGSFFQKRCERMQAAMERIVRESDDPFDRAWLLACRGGAAWFRGDWRSCVQHNDDALAIYRSDCRGVSWEIALAEAYRLPALASLGEIVRLCEIVPRAYAEARERGDLFAANTLRLGQQSFVLLVDDRPDDAVAEANDAIAPFPSETFLGPHYHHLFAIAQADLYRERPDLAWSRITKAWRSIVDASFLRAQSLRVEIRHLRARAALAAALAKPSERKPLHRVAREDATAIAKDAVPAAAPTAAAIRAGIAATEGRRDDAIAELDLAVRGFDDAHMTMYAMAARDRLGALAGGDTGAQLQATSAEWMTSQHIRRPAHVIRLLVPGIA